VSAVKMISQLHFTCTEYHQQAHQPREVRSKLVSSFMEIEINTNSPANLEAESIA
jgi:hypothetical protein